MTISTLWKAPVVPPFVREASKRPSQTLTVAVLCCLSELLLVTRRKYYSRPPGGIPIFFLAITPERLPIVTTSLPQLLLLQLLSPFSSTIVDDRGGDMPSKSRHQQTPR